MRRLTSSVQRPSLPILLSAIAVAFLASLSIFFSSPPALDASAETKNIAIIHDVDSQSFVGNEIEQFLQEFTNHNITLVQLGALADAKLAQYDLIILSPETGRQTDWGMSDSQYKRSLPAVSTFWALGKVATASLAKPRVLLAIPTALQRLMRQVSYPNCPTMTFSIPLSNFLQKNRFKYFWKHQLKVS